MVGKTLFRYPGGKYYALKILKPFWQIPHTEYREPFVGGGSVFFGKDKVKINWLNDLDSELIECYKAVKDTEDRKWLIDRFAEEIASKERWREVMNFLPNTSKEIAWKYYYLNRTSFSGKLVNAAWGYREKRSLPPERWHERLSHCGDKLEGVKLTNYDFDEVINVPSVNQVLMFVDPPYFKPPKKKHYRHGMSKSDHIRLANCLKGSNHKFLLTYDDCKDIRELYNWATIKEISYFYRVGDSKTSGSRRKLGFELVISNFDLDILMEE